MTLRDGTLLCVCSRQAPWQETAPGTARVLWHVDPLLLNRAAHNSDGRCCGSGHTFALDPMPIALIRRGRGPVRVVTTSQPQEHR